MSEALNYKDIPKTTALTYISGLHSLNLDLRDGTGCGWHFANMWLGRKSAVKLYGKNTDRDTTHIFGYAGVADRSEELKRLGIPVTKVYIANHQRAVVDSVYESLMKYRHVGEIYGEVDFFFPEEAQKKELFSYALELRNHLDKDRRGALDDWLSGEFRSLYKDWKSGRVQGT